MAKSVMLCPETEGEEGVVAWKMPRTCGPVWSTSNQPVWER
jgi:hypothetical protein